MHLSHPSVASVLRHVRVGSAPAVSLIDTAQGVLNTHTAVPLQCAQRLLSRQTDSGLRDSPGAVLQIRRAREDAPNYRLSAETARADAPREVRCAGSIQVPTMDVCPSPELALGCQHWHVFADGGRADRLQNSSPPLTINGDEWVSTVLWRGR